MNAKSLYAVIVILVLVLIGSRSLYIVKATERAVELRFGEVTDSDVKAGLHFKVPFVDVVRKFDGRIQTLDADPKSFLTLEKKRLMVDYYVKWKVEQPQKFYTSTRGDLLTAQQRLGNNVEDKLRNQFGERTLNEVVSNEREEVMNKVIETLSGEAKEQYGISVIDVRIKRVDLPPEVSASVYDRMSTERQRLARELRSQGKELAEGIRADADRQRTVIMANAYKQSEETRGEGDAKAARIYAKAYQADPEFYAFTRSLKAYRDSFKNGNDILVLKPDSEFFRYLTNAKGQGK